MIYGVLAQAAGLPPLLAQAMSAIVFAGSAQFIGLQLFAAATPVGVIVSTTFNVNLRHLLYSASVAPHLKHLSPPWQWLLAHLLTGKVYAVTIFHYERNEADPARKHLFLLGAGLTEWGFWQASTALGIFLGAQVPPSWSLDFTLALTFIGLMVPGLRTWPEVASVADALSAIIFPEVLQPASLLPTSPGYPIESAWGSPIPHRPAHPPRPQRPWLLSSS